MLFAVGSGDRWLSLANDGDVRIQGDLDPCFVRPVQEDLVDIRTMN